ncbi:hypothetical protein [Brachybacterium hainanense]|uniref:Uncharacterized protein n=1 Tax=Brachybacterium hainanense TaxID=1541174 RepID=A0ABV6R828_9MICO
MDHHEAPSPRSLPAAAGAVLGGILSANSIPHLATAAAGRRMLTPLAGKDSSPAVNALWGAANLAAGLLVIRAATAKGARWAPQLPRIAAGAAAFSLWAVVGEKVFGFTEKTEASAPRT